MYYSTTMLLIVSMVFSVIFAVRGSTIYDRILAANMLSTQTVLLLALLAFLINRPDLLDVAFSYTLTNLIGVLAILKFLQKRAITVKIEPVASHKK